MNNERVLISGAGIAGQTLAYWLARHGFRPTVVERSAELPSGGQGVDIRDQAVEVAERMGIMPRVRAMAADVAGMRFVAADGRETAHIDTDAIKEKNDSGEAEIMRGDLVALLHEINTGAVEYRFADSIDELVQDDSGITVTFGSGVTERYDLVVGADGLHSAVRRLAFGPETDHVRHLDHYAAFGNADASLGPDRRITVYNTPGRMAGIYRSGAHSQAKAYFAFRSPRIDYDYHDPADARRIMREQFGSETDWRVPELLAGALADPNLYFDSLAQVRMKTWAAGRVVLVGDAAFCASPVSGAGAELSITGAYRLAGELAAAGGDYRTAFPRYEQAHRGLVDRKQKIGPNLRLLVPRTRPGITVRNIVTRLPLAGMERIMAPKADAPLPDYRPAEPPAQPREA